MFMCRCWIHLPRHLCYLTPLLCFPWASFVEKRSVLFIGVPQAQLLLQAQTEQELRAVFSIMYLLLLLLPVMKNKMSTTYRFFVVIMRLSSHQKSPQVRTKSMTLKTWKKYRSKIPNRRIQVHLGSHYLKVKFVKQN